MTITVCRWDDPDTWNAFVSSTPGAHFQQSWEWGELAPLLGGRATRFAAIRGGTIVSAMRFDLRRAVILAELDDMSTRVRAKLMLLEHDATRTAAQR